MSTPWGDADAYERYIGRWSRRLAPKFVEWVGVPEGARALDLGCGTGALSAALLEAGASSVVGVDASHDFIAHAREVMKAKGAKVRFEQGDATDLDAPDGAFDAALSGLVLNFISDPERMVAEMARVTRRGGVIALYVWDYAGKMEMLRHFWDAAVDLDPKRAGPLDEGVRFPLCHPRPLRALFESAGLQDVAVADLDLPTVFENFDDYWQPFTGGTAPAPTYVAGLSPRARERLRSRLEEVLPTAPGGRIPLRARAFAVRGRTFAPAGKARRADRGKGETHK